MTTQLAEIAERVKGHGMKKGKNTKPDEADRIARSHNGLLGMKPQLARRIRAAIRRAEKKAQPKWRLCSDPPDDYRSVLVIDCGEHRLVYRNPERNSGWRDCRTHGLCHFPPNALWTDLPLPPSKKGKPNVKRA